MNVKIFIRVLVLLIVGGAIVGAAAWYKMSQKADLGQEVRADAQAAVLEGVDPTNREYVKGLIAWAHAEAYEAAFTREGLTGGTVDQRTYESRLLDLIIEQARRDGQDGVASGLEHWRAEAGV